MGSTSATPGAPIAVPGLWYFESWLHGIFWHTQMEQSHHQYYQFLLQLSKNKTRPSPPARLVMHILKKKVIPPDYVGSRLNRVWTSSWGITIFIMHAFWTLCKSKKNIINKSICFVVTPSSTCTFPAVTSQNFSLHDGGVDFCQLSPSTSGQRTCIH